MKFLLDKTKKSEEKKKDETKTDYSYTFKAEEKDAALIIKSDKPIDFKRNIIYDFKETKEQAKLE